MKERHIKRFKAFEWCGETREPKKRTPALSVLKNQSRSTTWRAGVSISLPASFLLSSLLFSM